MPFVYRNTIILSVVLIFILGFGIYFRFSYQEGILKKISADFKNADFQDLMEYYNLLVKDVHDKQYRWDNRTKYLPAIDVTTETYAYLNHLLRLSGLSKLTMSYAGVKQESDFGYNVYVLSGDGNFQNLYFLIWHIENGSRLFEIGEINLKEAGEAKGARSVLFKINLYAYYTSKENLAPSPGYQEGTPNRPRFNPFTRLVYSYIPPNTKGLVEVERSKLIGVIPGKAFIQDQRGKMVTLSEGDEVYRGHVSKIIPEEGKVEFKLDKGRIVVLKIQFEKKE